MIVLDTNVVSGLMKAVPDQKLLEWIDRQPSTSVWTTVVTVLECRVGIAKLSAGRRREALAKSFDDVLRHS